MNEEQASVNWYPGHMAKTRKEITSIISMVDIVIEVIDARIPLSSSIIVFNKYDLCDKDETDKWIKKYTDEGSVCVTCDSKNSNDYKKIINEVNKLMIEINDKRKKKGLLPKKAKCIVIGVPNVGKSTLINKFAGKNILGVGNKPGVTKNLSTIKINDNIDLVDTPGILWPKLQSQFLALNLSSMTIVKEDILSTIDVAIHILSMLDKYYPEILKNNFGIDHYNNDEVEELFEKISKNKNIPVNGVVDYDRVSLVILNSIKQEKIKNITFDRL